MPLQTCLKSALLLRESGHHPYSACASALLFIRQNTILLQIVGRCLLNLQVQDRWSCVISLAYFSHTFTVWFRPLFMSLLGVLYWHMDARPSGGRFPLVGSSSVNTGDRLLFWSPAFNAVRLCISLFAFGLPHLLRLACLAQIVLFFRCSGLRRSAVSPLTFSAICGKINLGFFFVVCILVHFIYFSLLALRFMSNQIHGFYCTEGALDLPLYPLHCESKPFDLELLNINRLFTLSVYCLFDCQVAECFGWLNIRGFAPLLVTVCRIEV